VVEGINLSRLSIANFLTVLANPNVAEALFNTLVACGGGTLIAVVIGLAFSWIVVRTNTPFKGFIAAASILPLFAPPLVAGVGMGDPRFAEDRLITPCSNGSASTGGWIFTRCGPGVRVRKSTTRRMSTCLPPRRCATWIRAWRRPRKSPAPRVLDAVHRDFSADHAGDRIGHAVVVLVMLGIYGIPAVLGAPINLSVLTTYIFKLTNWSPPLYNTAAAVAIILDVVTGLLVFLQQKVLSGRSYTTVAGKAYRPRNLDLGRWRWFTFGLGIVYLLVVVVLPSLALIVAAFRKFMFIRDVAKPV